MDAAAFVGHVRAQKAPRVDNRPLPITAAHRSAPPAAKPPGAAGKPPFGKDRYPASFAGRPPGAKSKAPRKRELRAALASAIGVLDQSHAAESSAADFLSRFGVGQNTVSRLVNQIDRGEIAIGDAVSRFAASANRARPGSISVANVSTAGGIGRRPAAPPAPPLVPRARKTLVDVGPEAARLGARLTRMFADEEHAALREQVEGLEEEYAAVVEIDRERVARSRAAREGAPIAGGTGDRGVGEMPESGGQGPGVADPTSVGLAQPGVSASAPDDRALPITENAGATGGPRPTPGFLASAGIPPELPPVDEDPLFGDLSAATSRTASRAVSRAPSPPPPAAAASAASAAPRSRAKSSVPKVTTRAPRKTRE